LASVYEIQVQNRPEKCVSICSDRLLWKLFRPSERLHWPNSAQRHWMISHPGMQWVCTGSLDVLENKVVRLPTSSQGAALL
jgi:hypothetical protein